VFLSSHRKRCGRSRFAAGFGKLLEMLPRNGIVGRFGARGRQRGVYECRVKSFDSIPRGKVALSQPFSIGGFGWRMGVKRYVHPLCLSEAADERLNEMLELSLFSCNSESVYSDMKFVIVDPKEAKWPSDERNSKVAGPFACMERCSTHLSNLWDLNQRDRTDTFVARVDLKNIRAATHDEQRSEEIGQRIILKIIDRKSINRRLNKNTVFGIAPSSTERNCTVNSTSRVQLWCREDPDCRYLLCQRLSDGNLIVKRCLNDAPIDETFGQVIENEAHPTLTVLEETKRSGEAFQVVDDDAIFVFIKILEPPFTDLSYLGFLQVKKTTKCRNLLDEVHHRLMNDRVTRRYNMYLETGVRSIEEITFENSTLEEIGMHSGSCIIIRCRMTPNEEVLMGEILRDLRKNHVEECEGSECMQFEIVNCSGIEMSPDVQQWTAACVRQRVTSSASDKGSCTRLERLPRHSSLCEPLSDSPRTDGLNGHVDSNSSCFSNRPNVQAIHDFLSRLMNSLQRLLGF